MTAPWLEELDHTWEAMGKCEQWQGRLQYQTLPCTQRQGDEKDSVGKSAQQVTSKLQPTLHVSGLPGFPDLVSSSNDSVVSS